MECIFCGSALSRGQEGNLAEEHAYPKWLQNRVGARHKEIVNVTEDVVDGTRRQLLHTLERFVAKRVCKGCNGGWMNELECKVKGLLEPVFLGQAAVHNLPPIEQAILARWAMKTALAVIAASPAKSMVAPEEHYRLLANGGELPQGVHVFATHVGGATGRFGLYMIGRYSLVQGDAFSFHGEELKDSYTVVIHFGNTVLAVMNCSAPEHVLVINERQHLPLARSLTAYGWYDQPSAPRREFDDERELWDHFVRGILVMKSMPPRGSTFRTAEGLLTTVKAPDGIRSVKPPSVTPSAATS